MLGELFIASTSAGKLPLRVLTVKAAEPVVVFEDSDLLVVDKPGNLACHSSDRPTLVGWLRERGIATPRLVNRLDRETSGLVIVAKNERMGRILGKQVLRRELQKEYVAICWGHFRQASGTIDQPIAVRDGGPVFTKRVVNPAGKPSLTEYEVEQELTGFSVVRLRPRTGRAHQLRVHLAWLGHPIVGDKIYGPDETLYLQFIREGVTEEMLGKLLMPRQALHAVSVTLRNSWTAVPAVAWAAGETPAQLTASAGTAAQLCFEAPLPEDMQTFIAEHA